MVKSFAYCLLAGVFKCLKMFTFSQSTLNSFRYSQNDIKGRHSKCLNGKHSSVVEWYYTMNFKLVELQQNDRLVQFHIFQF